MTGYLEPAAACERDDLIALIPQMRAFARSLCHDATQGDDLAQGALLSAWRRRDSYVPGTDMKAWVFTIVRNQFYSDKRRSWRVSQLDPAVAETTLLAVSNPDAGLELDDVRRAIMQLPDEQREALILISVAGLSYQELAKICDCALGTVKSRVCRARQSLLALLAEGDLVHRGAATGGSIAAIIAEAERLSSRRAPQSGHVGGSALAA